MRELYLHRRFFIVALGGVFAALLAYVFPVLYVWVVWLLGLAGALVVVDFALLYGFGRAVETRRMVAGKFSNGDENPVTIQVASRYPFRVFLSIIDEVPVEFQRRDLRLELYLDAGEKKEQTYTLRPVRRGEYEFGQVRVFVTTVFSLLERRYSFGKGQAVIVYPAFMAMRKYELQAFTGIQAGNSGGKRRIAGISASFDQIKPYVPGDDPRTVNWKATAKCSRMMVNTYTEERAQQVYCLIDKGRTMQAPFRGMTMLDYAINATLVLSDIVLKKGDRAGLLTFANKPGTCVRADNRRMQLNTINEMLYNQQTDFLESDYENLGIVVGRQIRTRSLLVLFTNFDTVAGMKRCLPVLRKLAHNHLLLAILFEDNEINRVVEEPAQSMKDIYFKVLAGSFITEKQLIARELRNAGIYALLTEPGKLTADVINSYLELKGRGVV